MSTLQLLVTLSDSMLLVYLAVALLSLAVDMTRTWAMSERFFHAVVWPFRAFALEWAFRFTALLATSIVIKLIGYVLL